MTTAVPLLSRRDSADRQSQGCPVRTCVYSITCLVSPSHLASPMAVYSEYVRKSHRPYSTSSLPNIISPPQNRKRGASVSQPSNAVVLYRNQFEPRWSPPQPQTYDRSPTNKLQKMDRTRSRDASPRISGESRPSHEYTRRASIRPPAPIFFYDKDEPYYGFTNFSSHQVKYQGKVYPTSEHLFQCLKVSNNICIKSALSSTYYEHTKFLKNKPRLAEHIRLYCPLPRDALSEGRR